MYKCHVYTILDTLHQSMKSHIKIYIIHLKQALFCNKKIKLNYISKTIN